MDVGEGEGKRLGLPGMRGTRLTGTLGRQALSDRLALKPYWGKPTVRNFRGGDGDVGIIEARSAPSLYPTMLSERFMVLAVGSRLGHYDVTALIGEGGMGEVYRARDTKLDRDVALKVLVADPRQGPRVHGERGRQTPFRSPHSSRNHQPLLEPLISRLFRTVSTPAVC